MKRLTFVIAFVFVVSSAIGAWSAQCDGLRTAYRNAGCFDDNSSRACQSLLVQIQRNGCQGTPLEVNDVNDVIFLEGVDCDQSVHEDLCIIAFQAGSAPFFNDVEFGLYDMVSPTFFFQQSSPTPLPLVVDPDFEDFQLVSSPTGGFIDIDVNISGDNEEIRVLLPAFTETDFDNNNEVLFVGDDGSTYFDEDLIDLAAGP